MAKLQLKKVNKIYSSGVHAVKDVSFVAQEGEFIVIIGPSGCGKTTILRLIAGLEELTSGEILLNEENISRKSVQERNLAMVFQNYALFPHMSVYDNIAIGIKFKNKDKQIIDKKVREIAFSLGLDKCLERKPNQLSGGQKQRTALGRAIISDAKIFLFDEPLSNLDQSLRGEMRREIVSLHDKLKTTFVYVTHDKTEAMTMADRLIVMEDGVIVQNDTPLNIYSRPKNMFVARFLDADINFIDGELYQKQGNVWLKTVLFDIELKQNIANYIGKVTVAFRGIDIVKKEKITNEELSIKIDGVVNSYENLGDQIKFSVITSSGNELLVTAEKDDDAVKGKPQTLYINQQSLLIFDKDENLINEK